MVCAPPCWPTPPRNRRIAPSFTSCRNTSGTLQSSILNPKFMLLSHCLKNQLELAQDMKSRREDAPNMLLHWIHMEPISIVIHAASRTNISWQWLHITGPSQCPRVDKPHWACSCRERLERDCACGAGWSPTGTTGSFFRMLWHREQVSCSQARITPESQQILIRLPNHN